MSEYIKKEDVIQEVIYELDAFDHVPQALIDRIKRDFDTLPTADVVEVVRCKDCKFWDSDCIWCDLWGNTQEYDDGYCSYGEKKEQENE